MLCRQAWDQELVITLCSGTVPDSTVEGSWGTIVFGRGESDVWWPSYPVGFRDCSSIFEVTAGLHRVSYIPSCEYIHYLQRELVTMDQVQIWQQKEYSGRVDSLLLDCFEGDFHSPLTSSWLFHGGSLGLYFNDIFEPGSTGSYCKCSVGNTPYTTSINYSPPKPLGVTPTLTKT